MKWIEIIKDGKDPRPNRDGKITKEKNGKPRKILVSNEIAELFYEAGLAKSNVKKSKSKIDGDNRHS